MKILLFLITFYARFRSAFAQYCINDGVTDFQLTSSGYYVDSSISCVSVCNSYSPGVFFYAFYLEKQLCFCKNSSQLNITPSNCSTTQCLIGSTNCILSNYEYFPLSLGIIDWEITFNPNPALVDNEVQIQTKISKGDASSAYVIPTTNGLTTNGLPSDVQSVIGTTVKTHFYLPGLQLWSQKIGNNYSNPINTSVWLQIDEKVGGVFVNPLIVDVNGFYNFFLVITQGTRVSVNISLPMNKNVNFTADVICLSYGLDLSMFYNTSDGTCSLKNGFILNQVILSSGYLKKIKLKVSDTGTLKIAILRPSISSTIFCALGSSCTNTLNTFNPVTALVVKKFLFSLPIKGIIEIPMQNIAVEENDVIWIGGSASLYCNGVNYAPMVEMDLGSIVTFSMNETNNNGFFISFFVSKPIEYYIPVTTNTPGLFNFVVDASNNVSSSRRLNYSYPIQIPISGLRFANNKPFSKDIAGYKLNGWLTLQAVIDNGTDVMYLFDIPKLKFSSYVSSGSVNFKLTTLGVFTVYLTAGNKLNSVNTSIEIAVLSEISSIQLYAENNQLQNSSYSTSVTIFNGTNVYLILDFGDGTPVLSLTNINATGMNGFTYTISHMYSVCDIYTITAYVSNVLVTSSGVFNATIISSKKVAVFCILSQLNVITTPTVSLNGYVELPITKSLMLNIFQDIGSYRNYSIDWGDGTYSYNNQSVLNLNVYFPVMFQVQHMYEKEDMYNVSITCKNALQKLNYVVQVQVKSCSVPYVSFYYGTSLNPVSVFRNYDKDFIGFIEKVKVSCQSKTSTFEWNLTSSNLKPIISRQKGIESQQKIMYTIAKGSLDVGFYTLSLQYTYGETSTVYSAYVNVLFSPLIMDIENGFFNSIAYKKKNGNESFYQNFTISAENSNDPDDPTVGIKGITFTWRCKVATNFSDAQIVMANFTSLNSTFGGDACFNETWVNISSTSPSIKFSTQQFLEGINYHFEVCGTKYAGKDIYSKDQYKTSCFIQQFLIIAASAPTITLKCISNCATKLNFQERVIYSFVCEDCGSRRLVAKWIITSDASTEPLTDNDTTTGFSTPSLVIKRDILLETKNYTFNLIVGYADSISRASFEFTKTVCSKPTGGVCYVNPASGYALDTKFSIVCYGWRDADGLLFYRFYYDNGQIERMNLSSTNSVDYPLLNAATIDQPSLVNFVMGPGDQKNDYKIIIFLRVSNKYNAYTEQNFTIMVKPNKKLLNITDLLIDVNLNDTQSVSNLVQAISSTSNKNSSSLNKVSSTSNNEVRTQVISLINNLPIIDLNSFKSVSDGLVLSIKYPSEITSQAQNQAANIVERLSGYLTKQNLKGFGADSFDTLTQSLLNSISSLFLTDFNSTDPGSPFIPDNKTASSGTETTATTTTSAAFSNLTVNVDIVSKLFDSMNKYFIAAHSYKVPGEIATIGETKEFNFVLKKNFSFDVSNSSIGSLDGGFTFPNVEDIFNNSMQAKQILINNVRMKNLVYTWDTNRSENILTESQSLSIFGLDGLPIKVTNTSQPITIAIKNIPEKMTGKNISLSMPNDVYLVKLPLKSDCKMLLKFLFKNDPNNLTNLIVYIQYGKVASKFDYDIMLNISAKDGIFMTKNNNLVRNLTFANTFTNKMNGLRNQDAKLNDDGSLVLWNFNNSTYAPSNNSELHMSFCYFGPMPDKKLNENEYTFDQAEFSGKFEYEMKSYCAECNYWNENANKWMSDGCELDETSTNFLVTKCKCTHLTTFGGFFIAPNPLLPLSLALFKQGYILTVAVAVVILLWLLCLPFTRRMDKQDESKIGVCPLYDNREGETYLYQIIVHTGDIRNAGTKSNIFLTVAGDISESGVRHLKDPVRKCFQRSSCDVFIMSTCSSLGNLDFIRLWHDNSGGGWYLRNIIIIDLQTEKEFLFIGHRWMAVDRGNCLVDCVIPVASVEESTNFNYVFKTKAQHKLLDEHLWLSVLTRLPQSNFTRCQRLSVAFSLIMTSMMVSAMFYHGYKNEPEIENGLFNFSFDKKKIFVILICSCIKFPVELIFVKLFCTIRPFQNLEMSSDDISQNKDNKIEKNLSLSCSQLLQKNSLTSTDTATCIACEENRKSSSTKTISKKCFPVLCLYMTWFICIGSIFGCGFIVLWYGMSFGNNQSLHWLTIIIVDLVKEILLFAPIKIFISAIIISLVVKKVSEDKSEIKNKGKALALNESWLHKQKDKSLIFNKDDVNIQPPDPVSLKKMRDLRLKQLKMYSLMTELILYFFYAIFAFRIGYFARENVAFYQTRNIQELFNLTLRGVPLPKDYSKIYGKVQSSKHFWSWMEELFFPQVYPDPWYNLSAFYSNTSQQNFPGKLFLNDLTSKIVNGIRIRQVRIQPDSCKKAYLMSKFIKVDCLSSYASSLEETRDFDLNWKIPKQYNSPIIPSTMPWRYQTWKELDGYPYAADLDIYYGGGYVLEIFPKWKNKALLEQLKNSRWIDRQTRAVIIEFALFNAATNYFTMVTMALEFPASGGVVPTSSILTFQLFSSGTDIYVWHVLFILMVLVLTIRHCHLLYHGCKYFLEFWSLVESLMILFSVIAVGFFFFKGYLVKMLLQRLPDKKPQTFINFQFASYWDLVYVNLISIVIFFVTLKFIKLLQFNRRISMVSYTLKVAWYPLTMFGIVFFIILCSFVSSSAIIFGPFMDDYKTFLNTITSVVSLLLGRFSFIQYKNANSFLGPVFFYGFNIIVIWIIMNMFVSILNDAFRKVRTKPDNQTNDYEIIEFFLEQLKDLFGYRWIKQENTFSYQNEKIFDIKHESDTYKRVSHSNGILSKTSDFNEDSVENEVFYTLDSKNTIYASFPKKKYLLNSNEREISVNESFNTFINCVNILYLKKSKHE